MKTINISIDFKYIDGRKNDHSFDEGPLEVPDRSVLATEHLSTGVRIKHIDFQTGDIETKYKGTIHSGVEVVEQTSYVITRYRYVMSDDGVPCNEDTLFIRLECWETAKRLKQIMDLPYRESASVKMEPHPYVVTVLRLNNEEVELEVKDDCETTKHLVQLYNHTRRDDEYPYATGAPNDPVDTHGPSIYMYLLRKQ